MKPFFFIIACIITSTTATAQLKTTTVCPAFKVNVLEGLLNNDLNPKSTAGEIKNIFPCFTEAVEEASTAKCAGIFYKDKDIYFYPSRNYIEIRQNFKGQLLFKWLGHPKIKDVSWDAFQTKYGILILYYNKAGKINKLQMSSKGTDNIKLCE